MTGKPKYSHRKEDTIAFKSGEIAIPGDAGRLQWGLFSNEAEFGD